MESKPWFQWNISRQVLYLFIEPLLTLQLWVINILKDFFTSIDEEKKQISLFHTNIIKITYAMQMQIFFDTSNGQNEIFPGISSLESFGANSILVKIPTIRYWLIFVSSKNIKSYTNTSKIVKPWLCKLWTTIALIQYWK